jgi:hypothetical protein
MGNSGLEHSAAMEEIDDLEGFIKERLAANPMPEPAPEVEATKTEGEKSGDKSPL